VIDLGRTKHRLGALAVVAAMAAGWLVLAPTQLGGPTSFASIVGVSMEPHLHQGDLVVVRRAGDYRVGDAVAYRSAALHRVVLHRIVAIRGGHYWFKGDNNSFVDPGAATRADLVGKQWIRLPGAGRFFGWFHKPWVASLLAIAAVVLLLGTGAAPVRRGSRGRRRAASQLRLPSELEPLLGPISLVAGAAAAVYLILFAVALALPSHHSVPVDDLYEYSGTFAYSASVPVSAAYPTGRVGSGDAVFTRLVDSVDFRFAWRLQTRSPHAIHGTAALAAVVSDGSGWTRRLTLSLPRAFTGDRATVRGRLDLRELRRLVTSFESETGTNAGQYRVGIAPKIALGGRVAGRPVTDTYAPTLDLVLSRQALQLAASDGSSTPGLVRTQPVAGSTSAPNRLSLGPFGLGVAAARIVGALGTLLSLLVLGAAALAAGRVGAQDPIERELARSGQPVVWIEGERRALRLVDVRELAGLLRIARRYDRLVLFAESTGAYLVEDDDVVYRWRPLSAGTPPERRDLRTRPWAQRPEDEAFREAGEA
jgi:signal peptidase I